MSGVVARLSGPLMLNQSQIRDSIDVNILLETAADCLRFVTEFFEVISQSAPHIYHSALQLSPLSSIVRRLYNEYLRSPLSTIVRGTPSSWDSCTAIVRTTEVFCAVWSPCGKFIVAAMGDQMDVRDSSTLEGIFTLKSHHIGGCPSSLGISPDGSLLACSYWFTDTPSGFVIIFCFISTFMLILTLAHPGLFLSFGTSRQASSSRTSKTWAVAWLRSLKTRSPLLLSRIRSFRRTKVSEGCC
jgi:WD40 repeat protein